MFYVYLLRSLKYDETYVGSTNNLRRRLVEHNDGTSFSTKRYKPWVLMYYEAFSDEHLARMREHNLKHNGNAIRELKKRLGLRVSPRTTLKYLQSGAGFTLVEVLIVMGIFAILSAMVLVRYNRGNEDSLLTRQVAVTIADIRLAQEQSAGGTTVRYCSVDTGKVCTNNADCSMGTCNADSAPPGGMAVLFSCPSNYNQQQLYYAEAGTTTKYYTYADAVSCASWACANPAVWSPNATDGIIGSYLSAGKLKGDPLVATHTFVSTVVVKDIQLVENETNTTFRCTATAPNNVSPWNGNTEPVHNTIVPGDYPLQALIRFPAPDGRKTAISDNISSVTPLGKSWSRIDIMLGLTTRAIDCRVISVTKDGVISQKVDPDCNLAS